MATNPAEENSYVLDAESGAEMARLIDQDIMITQAAGRWQWPLRTHRCR